jgi:hypothetical protein
VHIMLDMLGLLQWGAWCIVASERASFFFVFQSGARCKLYL